MILVNSTTIEAIGNRRARGTAEIELMLSVGLLIGILLLVMGNLHMAAARMQTVQTADFQAFQDATQAPNPQYSGDSSGLPLDDGIDTVRPGPAPGLPNRLHVTNPQQTPAMANIAPVTIGGHAGVQAPPWIFSAYPIAGDQAANAAWFNDYVNDSHIELVAPLELAPPWTPGGGP